MSSSTFTLLSSPFPSADEETTLLQRLSEAERSKEWWKHRVSVLDLRCREINTQLRDALVENKRLKEENDRLQCPSNTHKPNQSQSPSKSNSNRRSYTSPTTASLNRASNRRQNHQHINPPKSKQSRESNKSSNSRKQYPSIRSNPSPSSSPRTGEFIRTREFTFVSPNSVSSDGLLPPFESRGTKISRINTLLTRSESTSNASSDTDFESRQRSPSMESATMKNPNMESPCMESPRTDTPATESVAAESAVEALVQYIWNIESHHYICDTCHPMQEIEKTGDIKLPVHPHLRELRRRRRELLRKRLREEGKRVGGLREENEVLLGLLEGRTRRMEEGEGDEEIIERDREDAGRDVDDVGEG